MKQYHIKILLTLLLIILIFSFWIYWRGTVTSNKPEDPSTAVEYNLFQNELTALDQFVSKHYLKNGLLQTNLKSSEQTELASGEDLLSESVGLMLQYYLKTNQEAAFEAHLSLANNLLLKDNGLYQWRFRSGQPTSVSASVDDLRIIKALFLASEKWQRRDFEEQAQNLSNHLLSYCVKEGQLLSYDSVDAEYAPLYYYDFKAIQYLETFDSSWSRIYRAGQSQLATERVSKFPFYAVASQDSDSYKMIENSLIALYLSEIDQLPTGDLQWFKGKLKDGAIYAEYSAEGQALSSIQSPAIYGIVAQIAKNEKDLSLYNQACQKLKALQYFEDDPYHGGFFDPNTQDAYSFDQLMGLLGY